MSEYKSLSSSKIMDGKSLHMEDIIYHKLPDYNDDNINTKIKSNISSEENKLNSKDKYDIAENCIHEFQLSDKDDVRQCVAGHPNTIHKLSVLKSTLLIALSSLIIVCTNSKVFSSNSIHISDIQSADVCFTTGNKSVVGGNCVQVIVDEISKAHSELLVQAYNFTEPNIIKAIDDAHKRGVMVTVILDKISSSQNGEGADMLTLDNIHVYIDHRPKIAHNKVMVIDNNIVITGSFNFSTNAECCNAENLIVLNSTGLAAAYKANFNARLNVSSPYKP